MTSQDWIYYDVPPKAERTSQGQGPPRALSQIPFPGLGTSNSVEEHSKRNWIRDTDSKYVQLAKAGGRKDLFKYRENKPSEGPVPYARVDWFDDDDELPDSTESNGKQYKSKLPDWYVHDECEIENFMTVPPQSHKRPIMGFDDLSVWKREGEYDDKQTKSAINRRAKKDK